MTRVTITTPSRLHFGLLGWGSEATRQFGGVGLMVDRPGLELTVERAKAWSAVGSQAERASGIAAAIESRLAASGTPVAPCGITIRRSPEPHVGLGSGTQLGMAIARAITALSGLPDLPVEALAQLAERGRRSGIGVHGFAHGGLIVDAGRNDRVDVPTHLLHLPWPEAWSVLLVFPEMSPSVHGTGEIEAFERMGGMSRERTERLCRLVLLGLLPSVIEVDLPAFGDALGEMQEVVGSCFAEVQRGRYASERSNDVVESLRKHGLRGVGQSSWGPCLYGFSEGDAESREHLRREVLEELGLADCMAYWTTGSRSGAVVLME